VLVDVVLPVLAVLFVVIFVSWFVTSVALYVRLRSHERAVWESLGSPMPPVSFSAATSVRQFLSSSGHRTLRDRVSVVLGRALLGLQRALLGFIAVAFLIVAYIHFFQKP
jgi:hypothetical protein